MRNVVVVEWMRYVRVVVGLFKVNGWMRYVGVVGWMH